MTQPKTLEGRVLSDPRVKAVRTQLANNGFSEEELVRLSAEYFGAMQAGISPAPASIRNKFAWLAIKLSFSKVRVQGLEEIVETLKIGKVALVSSHFSYADVGVLPYVFAQHSIGNVYYEGGQNVVSIPVIRQIAAALFRSIGTVLIKRGPELRKEKEKSLIYGAVLQAYISQLLRQGNNVLNFAGRGRHRTGGLQPVDLAVSPSIIQDAEYVVPVAITYSHVPEDMLFASETVNGQKPGSNKGKRNGKGSSIMAAFRLIRFDRGYGDVYVTFGKPIQMSPYADQLYAANANPKLVERGLHNDLTAAVKGLVTMTPNSALAATVLRLHDSGKSSIGLSELTMQMESMVAEAEELGVLVSPDLRSGSEKPQKSLCRSISYFVKQGALTASDNFFTLRVRDPRLLHFYANNINPTMKQMASAGKAAAAQHAAQQ